MFQRRQPIFFGDGQTVGTGKRLVKLVVVGELEFCEYLIDGIDVIQTGLCIKFGTGVFNTGLRGWRSILPSCGRRNAGAVL